MSAHFKPVRRSDGTLGFNLIAANGEPVMVSTEGYRDTHDMTRGITDAVAAFAEASRCEVAPPDAE